MCIRDSTWGAPAQDHPVAAWDKVMNLNLRGYFLLSQLVGKHSMIGRCSGRIINIASIAGLGGNPKALTTLAYNTSKGAVINFTRALACEWGQYNINVNAICPGFFPSKMTAGTLAALGVERLTAQAPLQRLGDDEDLKGICLLLASDASEQQSDFYSYRYFAAEGFLPGYNFPRLPLSAWLPGQRAGRGRDEYLQRPRFLAISEFGPRGIVYHEGARFEIHKAMLPVEGEDTSLTSAAVLCEACGYFHPLSEHHNPDLCERCLLYTSPSPRDRTRSRMPSSA